ncbi:MAG: SIS domain-containing protein [Candidatus Omnitrophica bacterium]|nr:SIS domain-containing protein [Candidatus Omnitrophota bacterium]
MKDKPFLKLSKLLSSIKTTTSERKEINFQDAVKSISKLILKTKKSGGKIMIIGNGGSASIASHIATDLLKNYEIPAMAFNDSSLLTCLSNDLGYEHVFSVPIGKLAKKKDVIFAISSSGKSKNILNAVNKAKEKGCILISLSGFSQSNPLRNMGKINFYVPSSSYGDVEISHLAICHAIADSII